MHACTVITRSYLAHGRVLARSFRAHHPGSTLDALVLDPEPGLPGPDEPFSVLRPEDLFTPEEWGPLWFGYRPRELAAAVKPRLLGFLLDRYGERVTYLDADLCFYGRLEGLESPGGEGEVVLVPRTSAPLPPDGRAPGDADLLRLGAYDPGFVSVGTGGHPFLAWWWQHAPRECLLDPARGLYLDRRWLDLAPLFFPCRALEDPTVAVAYWNLGARRLAAAGDGYLVEGRPLTCFHFSGYDPQAPWALSRHAGRQARVLLSGSPALRRLCDGYGADLRAAGWEEVSGLRPAQLRLPDGTVLDERAREVYRRAVMGPEASGPRAEVPNPATAPAELVAWLRQPARRDHPAWFSRYLYRLYRERPALGRRFPDPGGRDASRFREWVLSHREEAGIPARFLPLPEAGRLPGVSPEPVGEGVNLVGLLRAGIGLGEAARQVVGALEALGEPLATLTWSLPGAEHRPARDFRDRQPIPGVVNPFDVNLVCLNGPEAARFLAEAGPGFGAGRRTVGYWAWELEEFPESWSGALDMVDEVWMNSEFAATGMRRRTTKPVRVLPVPVAAPVPGAVDRAALGLPEGFMFLFVFDYRSVFERKNPVGVVRAFCRAFAPGEGPVLVVKSINEEADLVGREQLRYAAAGRPDVVLLEGYLSPEDKDGLMAACDCYVSLHRSEGFGLTMAEAMALGKPTIATGYSGNLEFMTPENSFLVRSGRAPVPGGAGRLREGAVWGDPDLDEAAALMRWVYEHPQEAGRVGERAREDIARLHGPEARARLLRELLDLARAEGRRQPAPGAPVTVPREDRTAAPRPGPAVREAALDPARQERALQAERDLRWLLRRLSRPPLGWLVGRREGYRRLRERWLGGGGGPAEKE